jgi:hypothetical protein
MSTISNTVAKVSAAIPADDPRRNLVVENPDNSNALHLGVVGDTYTILLSGMDTAGRFTLVDMHVPPGGGPPPHRHDFERPLFFSTVNCKLVSEGRSVLCALEKQSTRPFMAAAGAERFGGRHGKREVSGQQVFFKVNLG